MISRRDLFKWTAAAWDRLKRLFSRRKCPLSGLPNRPDLGLIEGTRIVRARVVELGKPCVAGLKSYDNRRVICMGKRSEIVAQNKTPIILKKDDIVLIESTELWGDENSLIYQIFDVEENPG